MQNGRWSTGCQKGLRGAKIIKMNLQLLSWSDFIRITHGIMSTFGGRRALKAILLYRLKQPDCLDSIKRIVW